MKALDSIKKALDYIEEHLTEEIKIDELATNCYLSPFYFQRLFKSATGHSVEQYVKARRLRYSTDLLYEDKQINEVALSCGFKSPEHFSRAFKQIYKMTPSEYKINRPPLYHVYKPEVMLTSSKLDIGDKYISDNLLLQIQVLELEEKKVVGLDLRCSFGIDTPGVDDPGIAWNRFHPIKDTISHQSDPHEEFGISHDCSENGFNYLAGVGVDDISTIPEGMTEYTISKGLYACCIFENEDFEVATSQNLKIAMDYFQSWFSESGYVPAENAITEYYSEDAFKKPHRIELWAKVNKK